MDYKEKYEMALEGIQEILSSGEDSIKMSRLQLRLQGIFPELQESEGEKIRKYILKCCEETIEANDRGLELSMDTTKKLKNWLEKQSQVKEFPISQHENKTCKENDGSLTSEDENIRNAIHIYLDWLDGRKDYAPRGQYTIRNMVAWLEKQRTSYTKRDVDDAYLKGICDAKQELEKQGKQSSTIRWNDVSLIPQEMRELLVEWDSNDATWHDIAFYHADTKTFWNGKKRVENVIRWCYIDSPEEQCEQKTAEWSEEDKKNLSQAIWVCHQNGYNGVENWLKSLQEQMQPKQE